jgi:alpha-N-arabinofuranosidase
MNAYGSPSYYAFQMFSRNLGDEILAGTPAFTLVQGCATRDRRTGELVIKLVNPQPKEEKLLIRIKGVSTIDSTGSAITLAGDPEDTNSITEPAKVVPVKTKLTDLKLDFVHLLPANSIVILKINPNY